MTTIGRLRHRFEHITLFGTMSVILALLLAWLVLYPLIVMFIRILFEGGEFQSGPFREVFGSSAFWDAALNTMKVLALAILLALVGGSVFAWLNERTTARIPLVSRILPVIPLLMPGVAMGIGWVFLAQERAGYLNVAIRNVAGEFGFDMGTAGPLNIASYWGLVFAYALYLVPFPYLVVSAALQNLDPALEEAARMSGASLPRTLLTVSLPSIRFALMSSVLLMVVVGSALFSIPVIIGTPARIQVLSVYTVQLVRGTFPPRLGEAVAVSLFLVVLIGTVWLVNRSVQRKARHATIGGRSGTALVDLGRWNIVARIGMVLYVLATSLLPLAAILLVSLQPFWSPSIDFDEFTFKNYQALLDSQLFVRALRTSFTLGVVGATISMVVAAVMATFVRDRRGVLGTAVDGATKLPGAIVNIVIGIAFLVVLGASPFNLQGTAWILLLAYLVIYMPQASIAAGSAADQVGRELSEASWMSGAGAGRTFRKITFPLMRPGLTAGWALIFTVMVGDLTASALLAGTRNPVVGFVLLDRWEQGTYSDLAALAGIVTSVALVFVGFVLWVGRPRHRSARGRAGVDQSSFVELADTPS